MNYHYDRKTISAIDETLPMYSKREFQSPSRSTVPLLSWLKHDEQMFHALLRELGMPADSSIHLEYTVKPPEGRGNFSHTDIMVISGDNALALEAKWTEPRHDTVRDWLAMGKKPDNRRSVMSGWLSLLQKHAKCALYVDDFSEAVYQMVHRASSACAAGNKPRLAYLMFTPLPDGKSTDIRTIYADLTHLWKLLGQPDDFPFYLIELQLSQAAEFQAIASLKKGSAATAEKVRASLRKTKLFAFEKYDIKTIS